MTSEADQLATKPDLRKQFLDLLDAKRGEQVYQRFMEQNTKLIPREFVQNHGIHFDLVLRKLPFGADYKSDFFYMSKSSDDWHLVFIEIEKPQSRFFRYNSNDLHPEFQQAIQQINRWRAWFSEPSNLASFLSSLNAIHLQLVMRRNPSKPKFVLVHGRRHEYHASDLRRSIVRAEERDDFHILSFDSLVEGLAHKHECYVGARHNETITIFNDHIISPELFGWADPTHFKVTPSLRGELRRGLPSGPDIKRFEGQQFVDSLPWFGERVRLVRR